MLTCGADGAMIRLTKQNTEDFKMYVQYPFHKDLPENCEVEQTFSFDPPHEKPADFAAVIRNTDTARSYIGYGDSEEQAIQHAISQVKP